jgi:DNA-binding GntR family transcriptional regulator
MTSDAIAASGDPAPARPLLADEAYRRLKADILRCRLAPGARVTEQALADRLDIGRAPVRTALAQLRRDGLVVAVPQVGYEITQVTLRDAQDLFEARELIELHAVERVSDRIDEQRLAELATLAAVECTIGDADSVEAYLQANDAFHTKLVLYGTNAYLAGVMTATLERMERLMFLGHMRTPDLGLENDGRHRHLVDAIADRDAQRAARVLREHLGRARERTFAALVASPALLDVNLGDVGGAPQPAGR